jgi:hypothetical protein
VENIVRLREERRRGRYLEGQVPFNITLEFKKSDDTILLGHTETERRRVRGKWGRRWRMRWFERINSCGGWRWTPSIALGELIERDIATGGGIEVIDPNTLRNISINLRVVTTCREDDEEE